MKDSSVTHSLGNFFKDKHGRIAIFQDPNPPLWGWIIFTALSYIAGHGKAHTGFSFLGEASIVTWAYLEIRSGVSPFRRVLGGVVLLSTVISHFI